MKFSEELKDHELPALLRGVRKVAKLHSLDMVYLKILPYSK
jgi:hypothetical protein